MNRPDDIYNVNMKRLALLLLPTFWRRPLMGAVMYAAVRPLSRMAGELRDFRKVNAYRTGHNGQVCRLRGVLNDTFDPLERGIAIEDSPAGSAVGRGLTLMLRSEDRPAFVPRRGGIPLHVNRRGYSGVNSYDFWVSIPERLHGNIDGNRLRAVVNTYKLASKRWAINYR